MDRVLEGVCRTDNELASKSTLDSKLDLVHALKLSSKLDEHRLVATTKFGALDSEGLASLVLRGKVNSAAGRQIDRRLLGGGAAAEVETLKIEKSYVRAVEVCGQTMLRLKG
jgi:hypothetical protein